MGGGEAMKAAQIPTIRLEAKEAISLINGTQAMLAVGSLALAGVAAGLYPARRAAMLQPVEALRKE